MKIKIIVNFVLYLSISCILTFLFDDKSNKLVDLALSFIMTLVAVQIAIFSIIVSIIDTESLYKIIDINKEALTQLKKLFDEFTHDTKLVIWFGIILLLSSFILNNYKNNSIASNCFAALSYFSIIAILSIVIESIKTILLIGKSRIEIIEKKSKNETK